MGPSARWPLAKARRGGGGARDATGARAVRTCSWWSPPPRAGRGAWNHSAPGRSTPGACAAGRIVGGVGATRQRDRVGWAPDGDGRDGSATMRRAGDTARVIHSVDLVVENVAVTHPPAAERAQARLPSLHRGSIARWPVTSARPALFRLSTDIPTPSLSLDQKVRGRDIVADSHRGCGRWGQVAVASMLTRAAPGAERARGRVARGHEGPPSWRTASPNGDKRDRNVDACGERREARRAIPRRPPGHPHPLCMRRVGGGTYPQLSPPSPPVVPRPIPVPSTRLSTRRWTDGLAGEHPCAARLTRAALHCGRRLAAPPRRRGESLATGRG
jgi:hypothetical protein